MVLRRPVELARLTGQVPFGRAERVSKEIELPVAENCGKLPSLFGRVFLGHFGCRCHVYIDVAQNTHIGLPSSLISMG